MRTARWVSSGILVLSTLGLPSLLAQAPPAPRARDGLLSGSVTNFNGVPIPRVEVMIVNTDLRAVTNDSGVYEFFAAPTGRLRLIARRIGFEPEERSVNLEANRHRQLDFELKGIPEQLDSVMIREAGGNGRMAEFWSRRMLGNGAYITRAEIEKRRPQHPSDLLRTVMGVKVVLGESGFDKPVIAIGRNTQLSRLGRGTTTQSASECRMSYYVDGGWVPPGTFHMDDMSPMMIEAVEVYRGPAETPAKFRQRDTACGLIVIWTREPPPHESKRPPGK